MKSQSHACCQVFRFARDTSKSGRVLSTARIGNIYMSRLTINPGVTTGNYYHKKTKVMFYVEKGSVLASLEHVKTKERRQIHLVPGVHVVHIPCYVAQATKNVGKQKAVLVFFTNRALRTDDDFPYSVL